MKTIPATLLLALAACATTAAPTLPESDPLVRGPVREITHRATFSGMLVDAAPGSLELCGIQATVDSSTRLLSISETGVVATIEIGAIQEGDTVSVYVDGPVAESCPVQGTASVVVAELQE